MSVSKINIVTLGCSKNIVDSENLLTQLKANGITVEHDAEGADFDTVIINTCGFINDAKEESINTILEYVNAKKQGQINSVYVIGCLSERYKDDLRKEIKEVDEFFGTKDIKAILKTVQAEYKNNLIGERQTTTPKHYAYLKISEGCDRSCAFCAIPLIRGKHISKPIDKIIDEARSLANRGVKEIILIAQDLTYYGIDIYKKQRIHDLVNELAKIKELKWIRLHYAYPSMFPMQLLDAIKNNDNVCNYLDIPFQHISDSVLKNMRRNHSTEETYSLIEHIRNTNPEIAIRTTLLVGHPGEDDYAFNELVKFVESMEFDRLGVFGYSHEEDTIAYKKYNDDIPQETKELRISQIMELQQSISQKKLHKKIGTNIKVLIDRKEGDMYIGRTEYDSPEVDGEVIIDSKDNLTIGEFYFVDITSSDDHDLIATKL